MVNLPRFRKFDNDQIAANGRRTTTVYAHDCDVIPNRLVVGDIKGQYHSGFC